jgi:hypothetical protein
VHVQKKVRSGRQKNILPKTLYLRHRPSAHTMSTLELKKCFGLLNAAAEDTLLPSCRRCQAGRRCCRAATAMLMLPTPLPCCRHCQRSALAKLPPPPPSWPPPLTPRSHQAAAAAAKLAAAPTLSPHFRHHRRHCHRRRCHCCRFCAFSLLLIVCAPAIVVAAGVFIATAMVHGGSTALVAACAAMSQ